MAKEDFAIVIGISRYPALEDLQGPVEDAKEFENWLITGAGVPITNIKLILSAEPPKRGNRPVQDEIDRAFRGIFKKAKKVRAQRLYVYFAGHGCSAEANHVRPAG